MYRIALNIGPFQVYARKIKTEELEEFHFNISDNTEDNFEENFQKLQWAIRQLWTNVMIAMALDEVPYDEIAENIGITQNTVRVRNEPHPRKNTNSPHTLTLWKNWTTWSRFGRAMGRATSQKGIRDCACAAGTQQFHYRKIKRNVWFELIFMIACSIASAGVHVHAWSGRHHVTIISLLVLFTAYLFYYVKNYCCWAGSILRAKNIKSSPKIFTGNSPSM